MHELMVGMFWGGLLMALPPVALGVGVTVLLIRHQRQSSAAERQERGVDQG